MVHGSGLTSGGGCATESVISTSVVGGGWPLSVGSASEGCDVGSCVVSAILGDVEGGGVGERRCASGLGV